MDLIEKTREFAASFLEGEPSSHDMGHINRVEALCLEICKEEGGFLGVTPPGPHFAITIHEGLL